jgi:AcrR family transcriptional regulator
MSTGRKSPAAREPQRKRGEVRVAALLKAATAVFAEKGYRAATMTEIAARAKAPIGSLYQFFPNKELLGIALMQRFLELAVASLTAIEVHAAALSPESLASAFLDVFIDLQTVRAAAISMLDAQPEKNRSRPNHFRQAMLDGLARILRIQLPGATPARINALSNGVLQQMKTAAGLSAHMDEKSAAATLREMRTMLGLYLANAFAAKANR